MNREILFRGQRVDTKEWVEGCLINYLPKENPRIISCEFFDEQQHEPSYTETNHEVIPETVGQFTGILDKNGNKIFEGDKIKIWSFYHQSGNTADWFGAEPQNSRPCYEEYLETMYATVEFKNGSFVAKNINHEIPLCEVVKGLGLEVSNFYMCGYGGSEIEFIECLDDERYGTDYHNQLVNLEGEEFYNRLEEIVNEITKEIEITGNSF